MKTYKQRNQELHYENRKLQERNRNLAEKNLQYKTAIEEQHLFDPVAYADMWKRFEATVEALESIKAVSFSPNQVCQSTEHIIAREVLLQISEKRESY